MARFVALVISTETVRMEAKSKFFTITLALFVLLSFPVAVFADYGDGVYGSDNPYGNISTSSTSTDSSGSPGGGGSVLGSRLINDSAEDGTDTQTNNQDDTDEQADESSDTSETNKDQTASIDTINEQIQDGDLPSDPQQLIAQLTQRVQSLQSQLDNSATADTSMNADATTDCTFSRNLDVGMEGNQVRCLQETLNQLGYTVAETGPGSVGSETTYFGPKTKDAVIRLQEANADQILTPVGLTSGTGYVGPSTREYLNNR
jgi:hypothetical protein